MRYLLLTYYRKPDGRIDESMEVARKIKPRDMQQASVILDFKHCEVIKASMGESTVPKNFDRIVEYYLQYYENTIRRLFNENGFEMTVEKNETSTETDPS